MLAHPEDFAPFLDLVVNPGEVDALPAFHRYCDRVSKSADWGGHPELTALAQILNVPIRVHSADAEPLVVGTQKGSPPPLDITFHRHYYALGEHYNSTEKCS